MTEDKNRYDPRPTETRWQEYWEKEKCFQVQPDPKRKKYYLLEMLPYPSGKIHMGHVRNYTIGDCQARYQRMKGVNVMHPIGWDAFGLPAENAAIKNGIPPDRWTYDNIRDMRRQLKRLGMSYDWSREIATCHQGYYHWEQWLFCRMYEKGLVYRKKSYVNWCDDCATVLANEQVVGGCCWRCQSPVQQKELTQWFFKLTAYAEELLRDLEEKLVGNWPERVTTMQRNWIGKSQGARIVFPMEHGGEPLEIFTTRPDTLFGVTFMSIAPEHPLAASLRDTSAQGKKIAAFIEECLRQGMISRTSEESEKKGLATGLHCLHPFTGEKIPIFIANFVVMGYGTGAVMAVPAHDQRDFLFAKKHRLPIKVVIQPPGRQLDPARLEAAYTEDGTMVDSGPFSGLASREGMGKVAAALAEKKLGGPTVNFRIRDWGLSRQRYWGAPIPVIYCGDCGTVLVPDRDLPVALPTGLAFQGTKGNPLDQVDSFVHTTCPKCQKPARRETDTMDTFVESSWYFLRYLCPRYEKGMLERRQVDYWMPVDQYIGGVEHSVGHLIYARFYVKVMRDLGLLSLGEPFIRLMTQGMVLKNGEKMSKSRGNVVDCEEMLDQVGADTVRLFSLFAAPIEKDMEWSERGVEGAQRFLQRVWRLLSEDWPRLKDCGTPGAGGEEVLALRRKLHQTIRKVEGDLQRFHFNTAIAAIMELTNALYLARDKYGQPGMKEAVKEALPALVLILYPFAPHFAAELHFQLTGERRIHEHPWPAHDPELAAEELAEFAVQVNGKLRASVKAPPGTGQEEVLRLAKTEAKVAAQLEGKTVRQVIFVPDRLLNIVAG